MLWRTAWSACSKSGWSIRGNRNVRSCKHRAFCNNYHGIQISIPLVSPIIWRCIGFLLLHFFLPPGGGSSSLTSGSIESEPPSNLQLPIVEVRCMERTDYDLIIIGGGLAGAALAMALAPAGCRILVIEQQATFRDRIRGEFLMPWEVAKRTSWYPRPAYAKLCQ